MSNVNFIGLVHNIKDLQYVIDENGFVNVSAFNTGREPNYKKYRTHDLKNGNIVFNSKMGMFFS